MTLFTVGPVEMWEEVLAAGAVHPPYFRTDTFSEMMLDLECRMKALLDVPEGGRVVFLTASGTGAMEAAVASCCTPDRGRALVVSAGTFGERFCRLLESWNIPYVRLALEEHEALTAERLAPFEGEGITSLFVTHCETSNAKLQDLEAAASFCRTTGAYLLVDAVSSFLCEPLSMRALGADLVLTASQKALALSPGLSAVAVSARMQARIHEVAGSKRPRPFYLSLDDALHNMTRGQTPFSPAISVLLQLRERLERIGDSPDAEIARVQTLAAYFRKELSTVEGFTLPVWTMAAGVTLVMSETVDMQRLFERLRARGLVLNPCGGPHASRRIRVGHMGALGYDDYDRLIDALRRSRE